MTVGLVTSLDPVLLILAALAAACLAVLLCLLGWWNFHRR